MRILFLTGRETTYVRNDVLRRAFSSFAEVDVINPTHRKATLQRSLLLPPQAYLQLSRKHYDLIFVGFYGHLLMPVISRASQKPILFDAFVSTFDTLTGDRRLFSPDSPLGRAAYWLDRAACKKASHILIDTEIHGSYFSTNFNIPPQKITAIPVGCREDVFFPREPGPNEPSGMILYYASYQPLHGVETVVQAASLLRNSPLQFRLIGNGQTYAAVRKLAKDLRVRNVRFIDPIPTTQLPEEIANAAICLGGHFGESEKAGRVVPGKIYQMMAMRRPIIAAATPANLALLKHNVSTFFIPPAHPEALADAINLLYSSKETRTRIAQGAYDVYLAEASESAISQRLKKLVYQILDA